MPTDRPIRPAAWSAFASRAARLAQSLHELAGATEPRKVAHRTQVINVLAREAKALQARNAARVQALSDEDLADCGLFDLNEARIADLANEDEVERLRGVEARYNWVIDPENGFFDVGSWQLGADIVDAFVAAALADPVLAAHHRAKVAAARAGAGGSSENARTGGAG